MPGEPALGAQFGPHPQGQEQGHAHPGQVAEGISRAAPFGIDHRQGRGQLRRDLVVVGDDDLQPLFLGPGHRLGVADAAIHRHHQAALAASSFRPPTFRP